MSLLGVSTRAFLDNRNTMNFLSTSQRYFQALTVWMTVWFCTTGVAISSDFERTEPHWGPAEKLATDATDGSLDNFTLLEAALIAGGIDDQKSLCVLMVRFEELAHQLKETIPHDANLREKSRLALQFLHAQIAVGTYRAELARLDETLSSGTYNCLTATILYICLCERLDLQTAAIASPGHVWCRLKIPTEFDVETTSRQWFEIADDPVQSAAAASKKAGKTAREITPIQLLAKVYYNRSLALLEQSRFREAVAMLETSTQWDPRDQAARENLLAGINNWALSLCDAEQYAQALKLMSYGRQIAPHYKLFEDNDVYVLHRWVLQLRNAGQYARARKILQQGVLPSSPDNSSFPNLTGGG